MLSSWKRSEKQKSDLAQDSAARALARASRADKPGDHDDEIVDSDDDDNAADDHGDAIDDDAPMDSGKSPAAFDVHFAGKGSTYGYVWPRIFFYVWPYVRRIFLFFTLRRAYIGTEILNFTQIIKIFEKQIADSDKISTC
jgi:hypothetical protein